MKNSVKIPRIILTISSGILLSTGFVSAQNNWESTVADHRVEVDVDTITKKGFTLIWVNKDSLFSHDLKKKLIEVHFANYPKLVKSFNKKSRKEITFIIDPEYDGIAATAGGIVRFNPQWFAKHPGDIDIVTHEVMHIVQAYPNGAGPWWVTEGVADYVRYAYGIDNEGADWKLPDPKDSDSYESSYRITARFFAWIEQNLKKGFVKKLDKAMRDKEYSESFWEKETGLSIDELWAEYKDNPDF